MEEKGKGGRELVRVIAVSVLLALSGTASVAGAWDIPAARITWEGNAGVSGDIPARTTICSILNPSGNDDTAAIQTAINKCPAGQMIKLNAGKFLINKPLMMKSGITLKGAGMGITVLRGPRRPQQAERSSTSKVQAVHPRSQTRHRTTSPRVYQKDRRSLPPRPRTAGNRATSSLSTSCRILSATRRWMPGLQGCSYCGQPFTGDNVRVVGQLNKVTAATATTTTLETPLYVNYQISRVPQGTKVGGIIEFAGVEDLTIDNMLSGNANDGEFAFETAANCWLLRVEGIGSWRSMIRIYAGYRNSIRSCKFHEGIPATPTDGKQYGSGRGYGIVLTPWASANLIEDNIFYHLTVGVHMNSVASGNVIAYNYVTALYYIDNTWSRETIFSHGSYDLMNLVEGNWLEGSVGSDYYHGGSGYKYPLPEQDQHSRQ